MPSVVVVGASGYAGAIAARLLWRHPEFELVAITAREDAGRALEESAGLMKRQAELFERTIATLRQPTERAKGRTGKGAARKPRASGKATRTPRG